MVILTSASIVAILRYTVTRSRRRRRLEQYSQDRRRRRSSNDVPRPLQEDISVSVHSDHEHYDHDCEFRQSKLPTIVLQPDGQTVDFAVEEVKVSPDQKEDEVDGTTRRNNSHRPFLVTVEVIEGSPSRDSTMDERGSDSIKYDSRQDVP